MKYKTKAAAKGQMTRQINNGQMEKNAYEVIGTKEFGFYIEKKYQTEEKYYIGSAKNA